MKNKQSNQEETFNINLEILKRLSKGMTQREISKEFKLKGITPNSASIIDKRLKSMKIEMKCKTVFQMMYKMGRMNLLD